jgi:hypothetical protein
MRIYRFFFGTLILLSSLQPLHAQKIKISGSGKGYSGKELKFYYQTDPVTKSLAPLLRFNCDTSGHFVGEINVKPSETVIIKTGIYSLALFIDSISDLDIKLPEYTGKTDEDEQNSFFAETKAIPEVVNDSGNLNNFIRKFDIEYNPVFNSVADRVMYNIRKNEIPALIEKLNRLSSSGMSDFFNEFVRYRLVMLNQVANGEYPGRMEDSILINMKFSSGNMAYTDLLEQMFTKYFRYIVNGKLKDPFNHALLSPSAVELKKVIILDGRVTNDQLAEYVIILNLFNEYFDSMIPGGKIILILNELSRSGSSDYIRNLAGMVSEKLTALNPGKTPPVIKLLDESGEWVSLADMKGRFIILSFGMSDNAFSVSEYGIMKTWLQKYRDKLGAVTVLRDKDYAAGIKRMHSMGFNWTILDGSSADLSEYQYEVTMYPSFMLIDRDGKISIKPCPFPSENLDAVLGKKFADENK